MSFQVQHPKGRKYMAQAGYGFAYQLMNQNYSTSTYNMFFVDKPKNDTLQWKNTLFFFHMGYIIPIADCGRQWHYVIQEGKGHFKMSVGKGHYEVWEGKPC